MFLKLPDGLALASKYRNVFVHCSYHYVTHGYAQTSGSPSFVDVGVER